MSYSSKTDRTVTVNTSITGTDGASGIAKYVFEYKKSTETNWSIAIEDTSLPTSYTYTGLSSETAYNFRATVADNAGNTNSTGTNVNQTTNEWTFQVEDAGKTVNYTPKSGQTYNVEATYSGYTSDQSWSTSDYTGTWSVWGTDDDYIYIISTTDTSKTLYLQGVLGYNNGVTLLDTLCDTCFTDKTTYPGSAAQNLKLEQVLAVKATSINSEFANYGKQPYSYTFTYPYIWNQYEKTQNNSVNNRSKAYALTTNTTAASQSYSPWGTLWSNDSQNTSSAWVNSNYYTLVMSPARSGYYWLTSRYVSTYSSDICSLGLQRVYLTGVKGGGLYSYKYGSPSSEQSSNAVRPLVLFPTSTYRLKPNGDAFDIVKKSGGGSWAV